MDDETFASIMSDQQNFDNRMNQNFNAILKEFESMESILRLMRERNSSLIDEMQRRKKMEMDLKSVFMEIKARLAEPQQMHDRSNTNRTLSRAGATGGRRENRSVYLEVTEFLRTMSQEVIMLNEKLRRKSELLIEAKRDAAESATRYQKVTSDLITKLNSLQTRKEPLYDDQCASEWRKIQRALDSWTRRTFKDKSVMSYMAVKSLQEKPLPVILHEDYMNDIHRKRAFIQSIISHMVFETVLKPLFVFTPNVWTAQFLSHLGETVRPSGSSHDWEKWRSSTSKALENRSEFGNSRLDQARDSLLHTVESIFGEFYSPKVRKVDANEGLKKIFDDCVSFKAVLERQNFDYIFGQSPPGTVYSTEQMNSMNAIEEDGSIVLMSTWPSIYKVSFDNEELLIEHEAVWTNEPAYPNNSATGQQPDVAKGIKQEAKDGGDEEEMRLIGLQA